MTLIMLVQEVALLAIEIDFYSQFYTEKNAVSYLEGLMESKISNQELEAILHEIKFYWGEHISEAKQNLRLI